MNINSEILTKRLKDGNKEAFKEIYVSYWKKVYSLCFYYSRSHEDAEEMTQQIFLSLWKRREVLDIHTSLENYLTRAARYQALNFFRDRSVRERSEATWQPTESSNTVEETVDYRELSHSLQECVKQLPPKSRQVFELKQTGAHTNREIAETLEISEKTVDYHISYIRRALKARLLTS